MSPPGRRSAPSRETEGAQESFAGDDTIMPQRPDTGPRIGGRVVIDARAAERWLSFEEDRRIARLIEAAEYAPAGADVVLVVSERQHPSLALDYLRTHGRHLGSVVVEAPDGETVGRWVRGLRDGVVVTLR